MAKTNASAEKKKPAGKPCSVPGCKRNRWARTGPLKMCSAHWREHNAREAARKDQSSGKVDEPKASAPAPLPVDRDPFLTDVEELLDDRPAALALVRRISRYMGVSRLLPCRLAGTHVEIQVGRPQHAYLIEKLSHGPDVFGAVVSKVGRFAIREPWLKKPGGPWVIGRITVGGRTYHINPWKGAPCPS